MRCSAGRAEASAATERADGRRVGAQAWGIYPRVRDIDRALRTSPASVPRKVYEVHPEVSFRAWNGDRAVQAPKKTREGNAVRRRLVDRHFGADAYPGVRAAFLKKHVADDDILDAFAALWSAERILRGVAATLPPDPPSDRFGLPMRIVY